MFVSWSVIIFNLHKFVDLAKDHHYKQLCAYIAKGRKISFFLWRINYYKAIYNKHFIRVSVPQVTLRLAKAKAGPVVTDNSNFVMDLETKDLGLEAKEHGGSSGSLSDKLEELDTALHMIPGVLETGLFVRMADCVYLGMQDGSIEVRTPPQKSTDN